MAGNAAKPFRKALSIAMIASASDLGATGDRVPGGVSPFDRAVIRHGAPGVASILER